MVVKMVVREAGSEPLVAHSSRRDAPSLVQDPAQWWEATTAAAREALREVAPGKVRGVAVDATSGTVLLVDQQGRPLTAGFMYDDTRAAGEVERVNQVGE